MRIDVARVLPMFGTDSYLGGVGRMHGTLLGLFTVADGAGLDFNLAELVTWVNDAVMLAPSMLRRCDGAPSTTTRSSWSPPTTATPSPPRVLVGPGLGRPVEFITDNRWYAAQLGHRCEPDGAAPVRGMGPPASWPASAHGGCAVWHLPDGSSYIAGAFGPAHA